MHEAVRLLENAGHEVIFFLQLQIIHVIKRASAHPSARAVRPLLPSAGLRSERDPFPPHAGRRRRGELPGHHERRGVLGSVADAAQNKYCLGFSQQFRSRQYFS